MMLATSKRPALSSNAQVALFIAWCLFLLIGFVFGIYRPTVTELRQVRTQNITTREALDALEKAQRQHATVSLSHTTALQRAADVLSSYPRERDLPALMKVVDDIARERGAKTLQADYAQIQWEKGFGRSQLTAVFTGDHKALTSTVVDLKRALPSARTDLVRIAGISATGSSPLSVDHLEARVVFMVFLIGKPSVPSETKPKEGEQTDEIDRVGALEEILKGQGQWYSRLGLRWQGIASDPFLPTARAYKLLESGQKMADAYRDIKVTGIAQAGSRWVATVDFAGKPESVRIGDNLGDAKVTDITNKGITLRVAGQSIQIGFGGDKR